MKPDYWRKVDELFDAALEHDPKDRASFLDRACGTDRELRRGFDQDRIALAVSSFTPVIRRDYRVGVPRPGFYAERINTDSDTYGGGNVGNAGGVSSEPVPWNGQPHSICLTVPPLATVILERQSRS